MYIDVYGERETQIAKERGCESDYGKGWTLFTASNFEMVVRIYLASLQVVAIPPIPLELYTYIYIKRERERDGHIVPHTHNTTCINVPDRERNRRERQTG